MNKNNNKNNRLEFLFSIDLEDVRMSIPDGEKYKDRLVINTEKYLEFLENISSKCTFFVVGKVAQQYPDLIKRISSCGHEIACHSMRHIPLNNLSPTEFEIDIKQNLDSLYDVGSTDVKGFRAPFFSLIKSTEWAYEILDKFGFEYSSSVLPAANPLYGWPNFGNYIKEVKNGIIEIPITLSRLPILNIPFSGGVYFRVLPFGLIRYLIRKELKKTNYITGYFHPHDIDVDQEKFMYPGINRNRFYNKLLHYNREQVFHRLTKIVKNISIIPYKDFIENWKGNG